MVRAQPIIPGARLICNDPRLRNFRDVPRNMYTISHSVAALSSGWSKCCLTGGSSMRTNRVSHCLLGLLIAGSTLFAQSDSASISGTLTDPSGAVVVGAVVQVTNVDT